MFDIEGFKIRCGSIGKLMTGTIGLTEIQSAKLEELRSKDKRTEKQEQELTSLLMKHTNKDLSLTTKRLLMQLYREKKYKRENDFSSKQTDKGLSCEEDGITLYARVRGIMPTKNKERISNELITGEYDLFFGRSVTDADEIVDIKLPFGLHTFPTFFDDPNKDYEWQCTGYMALSGAKKATVAYCLVNSPMQIIDDEKRRLAWRMNIYQGVSETDEYIDKCKLIERNHIFDLEMFKEHYPGYDMHETNWSYDISFRERLFTVEYERNDEMIESIYERIRECKSWMRQNEKHFI